MSDVILEEIENIVLPMSNDDDDLDKNWDYIIEVLDKIEKAIDKYPGTFTVIQLLEIRNGLSDLQSQLLGDVFRTEKI